MFCDTHGLDLPCKTCAENRAADLDYLRQLERDMAEIERNANQCGYLSKKKSWIVKVCTFQLCTCRKLNPN